MTSEAQPGGPARGRANLPRLEEPEHLHLVLSTDERDELLQCLLCAAPRGGEAMLQVLGQVLLRRATEELLGEHRGVEQ